MTDRRPERLSEQAEFQKFIENFEGLAVWTGDEDGFDYISRGYEDIWGRPVEAVREDFSALYEGIHPEDREAARAAVEDDALGLSGGDLSRMEHRVVRPDGEVRWVEVRVVPIRDETDEVVEVVGVTIDITERKRAERDLERQNERLDQFASVVSHDLRNPLNVARGRLELARERHDIGDDLDADLAVVARAHDRMERIVRDLLELARGGNDIGERARVRLDEVARDAWRQVDTGDATLVVDCAATVSADAGRLQQSFENLFRNSVEHGSTDNRRAPRAGDSVEHGSTDSRPKADDSVEHSSTESRTGSGDSEGSEIPRTAGEAGDSVEHGSTDDDAPTVRVGVLDDGNGFYVEDTGPGIPASERDSVLEPGYSTAADGTGFGLAIVGTIAEAHGWTIEVTEGAEGGARIEFAVPDLHPE